jgi:ABC-2 type transport system ATP-binding protein
MPAVIEARGLTKRFGPRTAVEGVDLDVRGGSCFGFLGPNGAGKTTLIRMLLGLARPDGGEVRIGGHDVRTDGRRALAQVGAIVEEPRFHGHLSGIENLHVHAALLPDPAAGRARIPDVLARVGLERRGEDRVKAYSMGMRQRLGVARALLGDPRVLVLDEPTNGLDADGMAAFRHLVRHMVEREGRTVFLSSHLLDEMQKVCDEVAIVESGRVVTQQAVSDLLRASTHAVLLDVDDAARAREVLAAHGQVADGPEGWVRVELPGGRQGAMEALRALVHAGVGVAEARVEASSLEDRYLDLTRRA